MIKHAEDLYGSVQAAREAEISLRQLYHWVDVLHAVEPRLVKYGGRVFRRFTHEDVRKLREMKKEVDGGYTLQAAVRRMNGKRLKEVEP